MMANYYTTKSVMDRAHHHASGWWAVWIHGYGYFRADTKAGLRSLVREALRPRRVRS